MSIRGDWATIGTEASDEDVLILGKGMANTVDAAHLTARNLVRLLMNQRLYAKGKEAVTVNRSSSDSSSEYLEPEPLQQTRWASR